MNLKDVLIEMAKPEYDQNRERVTTYMHAKHKRFIEDLAHKQRKKQYQVLYHILDEAMKRNP